MIISVTWMQRGNEKSQENYYRIIMLTCHDVGDENHVDVRNIIMCVQAN